MKLIYADNAATTRMDPDAFEAMKPFLMENYGNASQPYFFADPAKKVISCARRTIAECIGAEPEEIFFTSGGTESDNWAIKETAFSAQEERLSITSQIEHHAVLNSCAAIERLGYPVSYLPVTEEGVVQPESLKHCITNNTGLVSVMLANNEIGTIEPVAELAEIAHAHGAMFHTDAVQAVGHIPIDVKKLLDETTNVEAARNTPIAVSVLIDDAAPTDLIAHVRSAFASELPTVRLSLA